MCMYCTGIHCTLYMSSVHTYMYNCTYSTCVWLLGINTVFELRLLLQISELQKSLADSCDKLTQAMSDRAELQSDLESNKKEKSIIDTKLSEEKVNNTMYSTYSTVVHVHV